MTVGKISQVKRATTGDANQISIIHSIKKLLYIVDFDDPQAFKFLSKIEKVRAITFRQ
jgi:hypothetical protein